MQDRTVAIAVAEVRFAVEYGSLNERFWHRIDTALNFTQAAFGALALAGAFALSSMLLPIAGVILALISAVQLTVRPLERSMAFRDGRRRFQDLNGRAPTLTLQEIDAEMERLRTEVPQGMRSLERPALNRVNLRHHGSAAQLDTLNWRERLAEFVA